MTTDAIQQSIRSVCAPMTERCCRYLAMGGGQWQCAKLEMTMRGYIDGRVKAGAWKAMGDNCPGVVNLTRDGPGAISAMRGGLADPSVMR